MNYCSDTFRFAIALLTLIILPISAIAETSPKSIEGSTIVTAEGFIELVDSIPDLIVVDSRIRGDRKQGYVEGSVSLPDVETNCDTLAKIIPKKTSPTLFYCNGVKCGRSAKAVKIALSCGYSNIYWFRGGFEEWLAKGYPYLQE
ncbi:MAG: rhodanese-like domain-containing protein [Gammaproteobacteria bacterium]|jgi:rhodanese-related sulfurtransferase